MHVVPCVRQRWLVKCANAAFALRRPGPGRAVGVGTRGPADAYNKTNGEY